MLADIAVGVAEDVVISESPTAFLFRCVGGAFGSLVARGFLTTIFRGSFAFAAASSVFSSFFFLVGFFGPALSMPLGAILVLVAVGDTADTSADDIGGENAPLEKLAFVVRWFDQFVTTAADLETVIDRLQDLKIWP